MSAVPLPVELFKSVLTGHSAIPLLLDAFRPSLRENASAALVSMISNEMCTPHMTKPFRDQLAGLADDIGEREATPLGAAYEAAFISQALACAHVPSHVKRRLRIKT